MIAVLARFGVEKEPFGKQTYFFEDMLCTLSPYEADKFVFVNPNDYDPQSFYFYKGYKFNIEARDWYHVENFRLPCVIYDRYWTKNDHERSIFQQLKDSIDKVGGKVYNHPKITSFVRNKLEFSNFLNDFDFPTPHTVRISSIDQLRAELLSRKNGRFYLKPVCGSRGNNIFLVHKENDSFLIQNGNIFLTGLESLSSVFSELLEVEDYIIQPEISQPINFDRPFDIRVLVNLVGNSHVITGMGVRCGINNEYRSNLNQGGTAHSLDFFFRELPEISRKRIEIEISKLCLDISKKIKLHKGEFIELGFDILLNRQYQPCILEINSKPSRWMFVIVSEASVETPSLRQKYYDLRKKSVNLPASELIKIYDKMNKQALKIDISSLSEKNRIQLVDWIRNERIKGLSIKNEQSCTEKGYMGSEDFVLVFESLIVGMPVLTAVVDSIINYLDYSKAEFSAEVTDPKTGTKYNITTNNIDQLKAIVENIETQE